MGAGARDCGTGVRVSLRLPGGLEDQGNLTASITLSCVLLAVGVLLYGETLTLRQAAGLAVCGLGLFLITE